MKKLFSLALVMMLITSVVALVGCNGLWGFDEDDDVVAPNNLIFKNKVELDETQMPGIRAAIAATGYSGMVANAYRVSDRSRMTSSDVTVADNGEFSISFPFAVGTYSIEVTKPSRPNFFLAKYVNQADSGKAAADPVDVTTTAIALIASATPTLDYTKLSATTQDIASYVAELKNFLATNASSTTAVAMPAVPVVVTGLTLNKSTLSLALGSSEKLLATIVPNNATNASVTWESSNTGVATVDGEGNVTAKSGGTVNIKAVSVGNLNISATCVVTIIVPVTGITLDNSGLTMDDGTTATLKATIQPDTASNKNVNWFTSDASFATVAGGVVTALKPGTVFITAASAENPAIGATCTVTINKVLVSSVSVKATTKLVVGGKETLVATILPANATVKTVKWSSDNTAVASVDEKTGEVTANAKGTANIKAVSDDDSSKQAVCVVTVDEKAVLVTGVTLNKEDITIEAGASDSTLSAAVVPTDATNQSLEWSSDDNKIATVDQSGKVTAVAQGTTYVRVKSVDGNFSKACKVTVVARITEVATVHFDKPVSGVVDSQLKIEISGLPTTFTTTSTTVRFGTGGTLETIKSESFSSASLVVLLLKGTNLTDPKILTTFQELTFVPAIPRGAKVTVKDTGLPPATNIVATSDNIPSN